MKDELITYETAVLAKEKGFSVDCDYFYTTEGKLHGVLYYDSTPNNKTIEDDWFSVLDKPSKAECTAPTQSLLQRWLREKHNISVSVETGWRNEKFIYDLWIWKGFKEYYINEIHANYEQALEEGLQEALKLI